MLKNMFLRTSSFFSKSSYKTESMPFTSFLRKTVLSLLCLGFLLTSSSLFAQISAYNLSSLQSAASMLQGGSTLSTSSVKGDAKGSGMRSVKTTSKESNIADSLRTATEVKKVSSGDSRPTLSTMAARK